MRAAAGGVVRVFLVLAVLVALPGCTALPLSGQIVCLAPQEPAEVVELLFGRNIGNRLGVTEAAWSRFFDAEIATRFPDGSTVTDASGRWRDPARGVVVREPGKVVTIVVRGHDAGQGSLQQKLDAIVAAYKTRFRQQSVGIIQRPACVSF
jgi:hypothetical protein